MVPSGEARKLPSAARALSTPVIRPAIRRQQTLIARARILGETCVREGNMGQRYAGRQNETRMSSQIFVLQSLPPGKLALDGARRTAVVSRPATCHEDWFSQRLGRVGGRLVGPTAALGLSERHLS